jgi:hypothetical protein
VATSVSITPCDDGSAAMTKLVQICASQNDLFGLDTEGIVYQYDFKAKTWKRLKSSETYAETTADEKPAR